MKASREDDRWSFVHFDPFLPTYLFESFVQKQMLVTNEWISEVLLNFNQTAFLTCGVEGIKRGQFELGFSLLWGVICYMIGFGFESKVCVETNFPLLLYMYSVRLYVTKYFYVEYHPPTCTYASNFNFFEKVKKNYLINKCR